MAFFIEDEKLNNEETSKEVEQSNQAEGSAAAETKEVVRSPDRKSVV